MGSYPGSPWAIFIGQDECEVRGNKAAWSWVHGTPPLPRPILTDSIVQDVGESADFAALFELDWDWDPFMITSLLVTTNISVIAGHLLRNRMALWDNNP